MHSNSLRARGPLAAPALLPAPLLQTLLLPTLVLALGLGLGWAQPLSAQDEEDPLGNLFGEELEGGEEVLPAAPLERAGWFLARGRHDEALAELSALRAARPEDPAPRLLLVRLQLKTGARSAAVETLAKLLETDPQSPGAQLLSGVVAEDRGELSEALACYARAVTLGLGKDPLAVEALVRRAELASEIDAGEGERELRRALAHYAARSDLSAAEFTWIARACRIADRFPAIKSEYRKHMLEYSRRMLDQALKLDPEFAPAHREAGELALRAMNHPLAKKSFERVIARDPNDPGARVGLADALLASFYGGAGKYEVAADHLQKALAVDPSHAGAHATLARISVLDGDYPSASDRVTQALAAHPGDVALLAVRAAVEMIRGETDAFAASEKAALSARPRCARFYEEVATLVQMKFRYAEARDLARKALEVDPGYHYVLAILGVNLTRTGDELEGRRILAKAFEHDPFNVFVFNHLQLWERLDDEYVEVKRPGIRLRVHKDELKVTTRYLADLVEEARVELGGKYGALPEEVLIELFPKWADFSTRSVGLPGIPALGVCFGPVVTVLSSKEKKTFGAHSWGRTLWHEFAHVCTLTRSKNRVPRWLTEGLSVYEEPRGRATWVREYDADLMTLREFGLLLPVATLDEGFTKPRYPNQVMMSYYQGGMICEFVTDTWGFPKLLELLDAYAAGNDTLGAIPLVFGLSCADFDQRFLSYVDRRYARYAWRPLPRPEDRQALEHRVALQPFDVAARGALARVLSLHGKDADAEAQAGITLRMAEAQLPGLFLLEGPEVGTAALRQTAALRAGAGDALLALGIAAARRGRSGRAVRLLRRALRVGTRDPVQAHDLCGQIYRARKNWPAAIREFEAARRLSPPRADQSRVLMALYKELGDEEREIAELREIVARDSDDAPSRVRLAKWAQAKGQWGLVVSALDDIAMIDPFLSEPHVLLGEGLRRTALGDAKLLARALLEFEVALELKVEYAAAAHFGAADCLRQLGRIKEAREQLALALADDPEHAEARALKESLGPE